MSRAAVRVGVGSRFSYDGEVVEVVEFAGTQAGGEAVLKDGRDRRLRLAVKELLLSDRARVIPDGPGPASDDPQQMAAAVLDWLDVGERERVLERAAHVREVLTGFRGGSEELAAGRRLVLPTRQVSRWRFGTRRRRPSSRWRLAGSSGGVAAFRVHALRLGDQDHPGADEGRGCQRRPLPGVPPPARRGGLTGARRLARAQHSAVGADRRQTNPSRPCWPLLPRRAPRRPHRRPVRPRRGHPVRPRLPIALAHRRPWCRGHPRTRHPAHPAPHRPRSPASVRPVPSPPSVRTDRAAGP